MWRTSTSRPFVAAVVWAGALIACPAFAADDAWCGNQFGFAQTSHLGLAKVEGLGRSYFYGFDFGCHKRPEPCQLKGYLVGGDVVVTSPQRKGDLTCVVFVGRAGESTGWVESKRLKSLPVVATAPADIWLGSWRRDEWAEFSVTRRKGQFFASGNALWVLYGPDGKPSYGPNTGDFSGLLRIQGNRAEVTSEYPGCIVHMARIGPYVLLEDDNNCGGMNVTFRGYYRREPGT